MFKKTPEKKARSLASLKARSLLYEFAANKNVGHYYPSKVITKILNGIDDNISDIFNHEKPYLRYRELIAEYVLEYTELWIFVETNDEIPYVSGDMCEHVKAYAPHSDTLKDYTDVVGNADIPTLLAFCMKRSSYMFIYYQSLIRIRGIFNDTDEWLEPFIRAHLAGNEADIRRKVGLPCLFENLLDPLKYNMFFQGVVDGSEDPVSKWKELFTSP